VDDNDKAWIWTTDDLYERYCGYWFPRKGYWRDVGTSIAPDLIPPALFEKARTQIVEIEPVVIVIKEA
jgi:hypothetical protein